mgnify:CR=1 FL=1
MKNIRFIRLREKLGLTQEELAKELEISQSMVARIENGDRDPSKGVKIRAANLFKVSIGWLFYGDDNSLQSYNETRQAG